jgi:hypothetical protein
MPRLRRRPWSVRLHLETLESRDLPSAVNPVPQAMQPPYGQIPLSFEPNQGQTDPQVQFLSRGSGYALFLTPTAAVLSLNKSATDTRDPAAAQAGDVLRMQLVGGNTAARGTGLDQQAGTSNYLRGNDPSRWRTGIANYGKVAYQGVYPGIDLVYYGNQRQLEYDFVVAPGAEPAVITLAFEGAESVALDAAGDLVFHTGAGDVVEHAPVLYQDGLRGRAAVSGGYVLEGGGRVGFRVGVFDPTRPLVIDPVLSYSTYVGGSGDDRGQSIAVDSARNAYVTGQTYSANFPTTPGAFQTNFTGGGYADAFVTKLNPTGTALVYSTYLGGSGGSNYGYGIAVDATGNAYVTGVTGSPYFPTTPDAFQTTMRATNGGNAFVVKLNPTGTALVYGTYLGGSGGDACYSIAVDSTGNATVTGATRSFDFPTTLGAFQTTYTGGGADANAFVTRLNPTGTALVYSTYLGGSGGGQPGQGDAGRGIAVDASGDAYVTGTTTSPDFPITPDAFQTSNPPGFYKGFVTKLDPTGAALVYSTYLGGSSGNDYPSGLAVDSAGDAYITGATGSDDFPVTPGAFQTSHTGGFENAFVAVMNPTGTGLVYSTYLGGNHNDLGESIAVDAAGNAYVAGFTGSSDFPTTPGAFQTTWHGGYDAFLVKLDPTGTTLLYGTYLGGSADDYAYGVALDPAGNAYLTGYTGSDNDFPTTPGALQTTGRGGYDAIVVKFAFLVTTTTTVTSSSPTSVYGQPVTFTATVTPDIPGAGVPTGQVVFLDGVTVLDIETLDAQGQAAFTTSELAVGSHAILAVYGGDGTFIGQSAVGMTQIVTPAPAPNPGGHHAFSVVHTDDLDFALSVSEVFRQLFNEGIGQPPTPYRLHIATR